MDKSKLYYLSHPCTTYGDPSKNRKNAARIEKLLHELYGVQVVNPIVVIPPGTDNDIAMKKCKHLYDACDAVIFCKDWSLSMGCSEEYRWAIQDGKQVTFLEEDFGSDIFADAM